SKPKAIAGSLKQTELFWQKQSANISTDTADKNFDSWLRWVSIQPLLRKIFGCSFLPDFDYGKGGRGWRDLWQDCLSLILSSPQDVKPMLLNNFKGVRLDGSNATIIGDKPGEFIADRNNLPRVWMDHGIWPLITTDLYIQQTADLDILSEEVGYFTEPLYKGTILEHLILQNLTQFFNVGLHNNILLQGADWNDGLDMAREFGESVAFTAMYAQNLDTLCALIKRSGANKIFLLKETSLLLAHEHDIKVYSNPKAKKQVLNNYLRDIREKFSGEKIAFDKDSVLNNLKGKSDWIKQHIKDQEWLSVGFFNGYYDNKSRRVEGNINGLMRMTLSGQVFPVMSGIADKKQIQTLFGNAKKYLQDKKLGGFRLNTDFKEEQHDLGRAFSFVYGDKENGAFFNHMSVMFAYGLYKQNFTSEGFEVFSSIYKMALDTKTSRIYPCLPEYFDAQGQGMYSYLTGSASWFMLTLLTQVFGVRGEFGDLLIEPKLPLGWFKRSGSAQISISFAGKNFKIRFLNPKKIGCEKAVLSKVTLNNKVLADKIDKASFLIPRKTLLILPQNNTIEATLI
ncbi:MAG: cellobiose phosphorylase, partial [Candidatus Omnitrophota bacterium]